MVAVSEREHALRQHLEPGRGVYDTQRASALAGVPASTLRHWAHTGLYTPSISPEPRTRLWSWVDLLALRAIDWFHKGDIERTRASAADLRHALADLEAVGYAREDLAQILAISGADGKFYFQLPGKVIRIHAGEQLAIAETLHLVAPYKQAPDLLQPRPLLRIIPGKLHGEPHISGTRIPTRTIGALHRASYSLQQIQTMYPDATSAALNEAIEFERSLLPTTTA